MKEKFKIVISSFLTAFIIFMAVFSNLNGAFIYAQGNIVKEITVDKSEMGHAESFKVSVKFGGSNTKVENGQTEEITFSSDKVNVTLPSGSIQLNNKNNVNLGTVSFENGKAIIKFNEQASKLEDVEGGFEFNVRGHYNGDFNNDAEGSITINYDNISKNIKVIYKKGGNATSEVYSKRGVWIDSHTDGNRVDWVFNFNEAKKSTDNLDYTFTAYDTLPDTMEWDNEYNNKADYVVSINGNWINLNTALQRKINVSFTGSKLTISIPRWIMNSYMNGWEDSLNGNNISVRLRAKVKDYVMLNKSIEFVENESNVNLGSLNWKIDPKDTKGSVKILRQGGWATGTKPGELKIVKVLKSKNVPIENVEFTLERKDGQNIEVKENGVYVSKGKTLTLVTNEYGIANIKGLKAADYIVKESKAPKWINFDISNPIKYEFKVSEQDAGGKEYIIENEKVKVDVSVKKSWIDSDKKDLENYPAVKVGLYQDENKIKESVVLEKGKLEYKWTGLDLTDDTGRIYKYTVKELDEDGNPVEEKQKIRLNEKNYIVSYSEDSKNNFVITNQEEKVILPKTRNIEVIKIWKDYEDKITDAPTDKIKVELYKDGVATGEYRELNKENGWKATFENLKVSETIESENYHYSVREVKDENGFIEFDKEKFKINYDGDMEKGFVITNTKVKPMIPSVPTEPSKTSLKVSKEWIKEDLKNAPEITVYLVKNGKITDESIKLNKENNWKGEFKNLLVSDDIKSGKVNVYSVKEKGEVDGKVILNGIEYKVVYKDGKIINTKVSNEIPKEPTDPNPSKPNEPTDNAPKEKQKLPKTNIKSNATIYFVLLCLTMVIPVIKILKNKKYIA